MAQYGDINPQTGSKYTPYEIQCINAGKACPSSTPTTTPTTPTTSQSGVSPSGATYDQNTGILTYPQYGFTGTLEEWHAFHPEPLEYEAVAGPIVNREGITTTPTTPTTTPMPTFGGGAAAGIPTPTVTPAPAYEISPEQQQMQDLLSTTLTDWVQAGGYGLSPEVQAQMIQQQTDTLKAREAENIRVMRNNMERRGITNSGFVQANENIIKSNTTVALAGAIADVQINSALMKMASFEKAMGAAAQFLGYLSEQSQLKYAPEFATWAAEQQATMQAWQAKIDIYKMELNQAYQTQNINLQGYWNQKLQQEQHGFDIELAEMELEVNNKAAKAQGAGNILGIIIGGIFSLLPGS